MQDMCKHKMAVGGGYLGGAASSNRFLRLKNRSSVWGRALDHSWNGEFVHKCSLLGRWGPASLCLH